MLLKYFQPTKKTAIEQKNNITTYNDIINIIGSFIRFFSKNNYKIVYIDTEILAFKIGIIIACYYSGNDIFMPDKHQVTDNILNEHYELTAEIKKRCLLCDYDMPDSFNRLPNMDILIIRDILFDSGHVNLSSHKLVGTSYMWFITSGTTGYSRIVGLNMRHLFDKFESIDKFLDIREDDTLLVFSSPSFIQVLWSILLHLRHGSTIVFQKIQLNQLHVFIKQYSVTALVTVPSIINGCINQLQGLRSIIVGGDYMSIEILENLAKKMPNLLYANVYGCTETGAGDIISSAKRLNIFKRDDYTLGEINPVSDIKFFHKYGNYYEIAIKNQCFLSAKGIKKPNEERDYFHTGDIITIDQYNRLYYIGRSSNVVVTNGVKISTDTVEKELLKIPMVKDAIVFGVDSIKGEKLVALYCSENILYREYFRNRLSKVLNDHEIPNEYIKVDKIPYTDRGKKNRNKKYLKEIYSYVFT